MVFKTEVWHNQLLLLLLLFLSTLAAGRGALVEAQRAVRKSLCSSRQEMEVTWTCIVAVETGEWVLLRWDQLTRHCANCVPMPLVQSSLYSYTIVFCKTNYYAHFINKKVPRSGLHWVIVYRPSQSREGGRRVCRILRQVGRTKSISIVLGLFS